MINLFNNRKKNNILQKLGNSVSCGHNQIKKDMSSIELTEQNKQIKNILKGGLLSTKKIVCKFYALNPDSVDKKELDNKRKNLLNRKSFNNAEVNALKSIIIELLNDQGIKAEFNTEQIN